MLRSMKDLEHYTIGATDGPIGQVEDFYFDDDGWAIRYLVVETGSWPDSRKVLVSPIAIHQPDWAGRTLPVSISQAQLRGCPDIDTARPGSRQHETGHLGHPGDPVCGGGMGVLGEGLYPKALLRGHGGQRIDSAKREPEREREREEAAFARAEQAHHRHDDPQLHRCKAVIGHHLRAIDGEIGHVEGLLVNEETWTVRYLVVNTSNWWVGYQVLLAPQWITGVEGSDQRMSVQLTRAAIQQAPLYDAGAELTRQREMGLLGGAAAEPPAQGAPFAQHGTARHCAVGLGEISPAAGRRWQDGGHESSLWRRGTERPYPNLASPTVALPRGD